ncbi:MAG: hypothetical protein V2A62_03210 [Candidatus Woesearchaeota archaeon]
MSLKGLLGLDQCTLKEEEIMRQLQEAYRKGIEELTFTCGEKKVKLSIK